MVDAARFKIGVLKYAHSALLSKMTGLSQFLAGMAIGAYLEDINAIADAYPAIKAMGLIKDDGVDVDKAYRLAKSHFDAFGKLDVEIPHIGKFTFRAPDLDELYQSICGA